MRWQEILDEITAPKTACDPADFPVAAVGLDHNHIYGMCQGLVEAGASVEVVFDPDPDKVAIFRERFPSARVAKSMSQALDSADVHMVACASIPGFRSWSSSS
jgi:predicted dehydrogenase